MLGFRELIRWAIKVSKKRKGDFMSKVWLVTGSASGLGRNIAQAVLASGDSLIATARDPRQLEEHVRALPLDVVDESAAHAAVQVAVDALPQKVRAVWAAAGEVKNRMG